MLLLAIDTAGPACAAALARRTAEGEPEILTRREETIGRGHAERLIPMIQEALVTAEVGFPDLDRIAVTTGPGSFTGIRVGIAAARGLALALDIPAIGIGSLAALAEPAVRSMKEGMVAVVLDAKHGQVYALVRDIASKRDISPTALLKLEAVVASLAHAPAPLVLIGSGAPLVAAKLANPDVVIASTDASPDIAMVARLGLSGEAGSPPVPLYSRGADARPQLDKAVARR
jgi:tRNA threonylcarbamoyladenosine biosynthesis protein TsaB